jgi:leucyl aminopeptidase (aminopeptidase T)
MSVTERSYMMRPVRRILEQCLNVRPDENLLVLTDTNKLDLAEMFVLVGREMGAEVTLLVMTPRGRHGEEPPATVAAAMKAADAIVAPTTFSVNHSTARTEASKAGARLIFMPDVCHEIFLDGSLDIDFLEQKKRIDAIARILDDGSRVEVRSPLGTSLRMEIGGKRAVPQTGICHEPGTISPPPCVEVAVAPDEDTLNGKMIVDGAIVPGGICRTPIELRFEDGTIVAIEGGEEASRLREILASYEDENIYRAVEMGMGMNPNARIGRASSLEDEAEFGTMHIGIGNGITFGSSIRAKGHCDLVMRDAVIEVDGRVILENRELKVAVDGL